MKGVVVMEVVVKEVTLVRAVGGCPRHTRSAQGLGIGVPQAGIGGDWGLQSRPAGRDWGLEPGPIGRRRNWQETVRVECLALVDGF